MATAKTPKPQFALSVTLADGTTHTFEVEKMPRHWCSWVMQKLDYGTVFQGCQFSRARINPS
jgi:hypothetical protein